MAERNQKLKPKTPIAHGSTKNKQGVVVTYSILYGNVSYVGGVIRKVADRQYRKKLEEFLNSEEGQQYIIPTEEEIQEAYIIAHRKEEDTQEIPVIKEETPSETEPAVTKSVAPKEEPKQEESRQPEVKQEEKPVVKAEEPAQEKVVEEPVEEVIQEPEPVPEPEQPVQEETKPEPVPVQTNLENNNKFSKKKKKHKPNPEVAKTELGSQDANSNQNRQLENDNQDKNISEVVRTEQEKINQKPEPVVQLEPEQESSFTKLNIISDPVIPEVTRIEAGDQDENQEKPGKTGKFRNGSSPINLVLAGITGASVILAAVGFMMASNTIPNPFVTEATEELTVAVAQVKDDISAGDVFYEDSFEKVFVTQTEYQEMSKEQVVKADGTTERDTVLLWDNRTQAYGKFAVENLSAGEYVMTSDYTILSETDKVVTITVDGQEVHVPVAVTTAGNTDIRLYAIVTSGLEDDTTRSIAINLGEFKLEGRTLEDVLNSEGSSKLEEILANAAELEQEAEAESTAEPTATEETE